MISFSDLNLEKFSEDKQYQRFLRALNEFIEGERERSDIDTMYLFGSFVRGELTKFSDIDVFVIHKDTEEAFEKTFTFENVEINALYLTIDKLRSFVEKEKNSLFQKHIQMLAEGQPLISSNCQIEELKGKILREAYAKVEKLNEEQKEELQTFLTKEAKNLQRYLEMGDEVNFCSRLNYSVSLLLERYCRLSGQAMPPFKKTSQSISDTELKNYLLETATASTILKKYTSYKKALERMRFLIENS